MFKVVLQIIKFSTILTLLFSFCFKPFFTKKNIPNSEETEIPALIWESKKQPNAFNAPPAIFYTPHQDDETLAMGSSIAESVRKGHPVYVVLLTNGDNPSTNAILNGTTKCEFHNTNHNFNLSNQDFINARNAEFLAACKALGVHKVFISNNGKGFDETIGLENLNLKFFETISFFSSQYTLASHHSISGNCDPYNKKGDRMNAHRACANALQLLYNLDSTKNIYLYKDYVYYFPKEERTASFIKKNKKRDTKKKHKAFEEYNLFDPTKGRYAIGYQHSVWELFNNSYSSEYEYIDLLPLECK